jgi:hypothetical protein
MFPRVAYLIRQPQVFGPVVRTIVVYVVDYFFWEKGSADDPRHH